MNHAPVHLGPRELREVYAEPFAAAIRDAGLASIMNSYSSVDGIPCAGSSRHPRRPAARRARLPGRRRRRLLLRASCSSTTTRSRPRPGRGRCAGPSGRSRSRVARTSVLRRTAQARLIHDGGLTMEVLDDGCPPSAALEVPGRPVRDTPMSTRAPPPRYSTRRTTAPSPGGPPPQSIVLLQNHGDLLPLNPETLRRVAVIGPSADDQRLLQGDYHYPTHTEIIYEGAAEAAPCGRAIGPVRDRRRAVPAGRGRRFRTGAALRPPRHPPRGTPSRASPTSRSHMPRGARSAETTPPVFERPPRPPGPRTSPSSSSVADPASH